MWIWIQLKDLKSKSTQIGKKKITRVVIYLQLEKKRIKEVNHTINTLAKFDTINPHNCGYDWSEGHSSSDWMDRKFMRHDEKN